MVLQHRFGGLPAVAHERWDQTDLLVPAHAASKVPHHEHRSRSRTVEVRSAKITLEGRVVSEPFGLLVGVYMAADPCNERSEVHRLAFVAVQAHVLGQVKCDEALAQHMLHGLTHAKVGAEGQYAEQLRQLDPCRGVLDLGHAAST